MQDEEEIRNLTGKNGLVYGRIPLFKRPSKKSKRSDNDYMIDLYGEDVSVSAPKKRK